MNRRLILLAVCLVCAGSVDAQIIRAKQGIVREHVVEVKEEPKPEPKPEPNPEPNPEPKPEPKQPPQVHAEEIGVWKQSLAVVLGNHLGFEYALTRRHNGMLSYGSSAIMGYRVGRGFYDNVIGDISDRTFSLNINAFGKVDLFNETLKNSPYKPYFSTSVGVFLPSYSKERSNTYSKCEAGWNDPFVVVPELGVEWYGDPKGEKIFVFSLSYTYKTIYVVRWEEIINDYEKEYTDTYLWFKFGCRF